MTLGDLEFKAEDFWKEQRELHMPTPHASYEQWGDWASRQANRLLKERLEKAPIVFSHYDGDEWHRHAEPELDKKYYTHGSLVCIEEIK